VVANIMMNMADVVGLISVFEIKGDRRKLKVQYLAGTLYFAM